METFLGLGIALVQWLLPYSYFDFHTNTMLVVLLDTLEVLDDIHVLHVVMVFVVILFFVVKQFFVERLFAWK
jgi:hypothetical protein